MKRIKRFINNSDINRFRFYFQITAFGLLIYGGYLAVDISSNLPSFACPFVDSRGGTCYLFPLQHQANISYKQVISGRGIALLTGLGTFFLLFILFNKAWCGFACPLGAVQDWITKIRSRFHVRYSTYPDNAFNVLKNIKYILLVLLLLLPFGIANFGFPRDFAIPYCMICPGRTVLPLFSANTSQLAIDFSSKTMLVLTGLGMAVTGVFFTGSFVKKRFFCLFCPMSALQYVFSKAALLRLTKNGDKCTRCGNCYRVCDVGIKEIADDIESRNIVKEDCMMCFKCVSVCPENKCLKVSFAGIPVYESTEEGFFRRIKSKTGHEDQEDFINGS